MKKFKGSFLVLVIMLLSLGLASNSYAREREERDRDGGTRSIRESRDYGSRGSKNGRDNSGSWGGPKLKYDGRTSGIGRDLGSVIGGAAGGAIGSRFGGSKGGLAGGYLGGKIGERAGDAWERRANRNAHDKWNSKGSKGHTGWRCFSSDEEIFYEKLW